MQLHCVLFFIVYIGMTLQCIVLKLLGRENEFTALANKHRITILAKHEKEPLMASLKIHSATAHIMLDDLPGLSAFLAKTEKPKSSTDFNSSLLHHIDVIFYNNEIKKENHTQLIESWK